MGRPVGGEPLHSLSTMGLMVETLEPELASGKRGQDPVDTCGIFNHGRHQPGDVSSE